MWPTIIRSESNLIDVLNSDMPYIGIGGQLVGEQKAALLATLYDFGGIIGNIA